MVDHWEMLDLYKALIAMAAGVILGLEREMKDKAAGLKTITVICLGSALFAIISYKVGAPDGESTRIASYIVSGVGFLGAGVIFKDGVNVSGLTTAGIIWLAAAVGTAIGFGEIFLAITFMMASLIIIYSSPWINRMLKPKKLTRPLVMTIDRQDIEHKRQIISQLRDMGVILEERKLEARNSNMIVTLDTVVPHDLLNDVEEFLVKHPHVITFAL
jgi:putative Mg2+ transporter-C (MgtC) family protein